MCLGRVLGRRHGIGQTVQTIALLARLCQAETTPSLLVMRRSLLFNWQRGVERFCPALPCAVFHGTIRDLDEVRRGNLVLTIYGTLRRSIENFFSRQFYCVILDQSQAIKNSDTQTTKAVLMLQARRRLAVSGAPIQNHLGELFSLTLLEEVGSGNGSVATRFAAGRRSAAPENRMLNVEQLGSNGRIWLAQNARKPRVPQTECPKLAFWRKY